MKLGTNIERVFQQVVTGSAELAAAQTEQLDVSRELATELQSSLQNMKEVDIGPLLGALGGMQGQIVSGIQVSLMNVQVLTPFSKLAMNW